MENPYYTFTVPVFISTLTNLKAILAKGAAFAKEKGMDEVKLLDAKLADDMYPLIKQVQIATDNAKGAAARLSGKENPKHEDNEKTLDELYARIDKTIAFLQEFTPEDFEGASERKVALPWMPEGTYFEAPDYMHNFVLANFYFHYTTAYDILRSLGVVIGKTDFIGNIPMKES
jgi:hypothetical protein